MKAKVNYFRTFVVLAVGLLAVAVALFGVGLRSAETQTTAPEMQVQDLGHLGGGYSGATSINDSGQVVGVSSTSDGAKHAFLYDEGATPKMQDLDTLGGNESHAAGINDSGQVVGYSYTSDGAQHGFLYDGTNGMQDLNNLIPAGSGWTITSASAFNADGKIAASGYGNTPPDPSICPGSWVGPAYGDAFVLTPATTATYEVQDLGHLGGYYSRAASINDSGQVVGVSFTSPCIWDDNAFLYDDESASPQMQRLVPGKATGINHYGQVVGYAQTLINGSCLNLDCWHAFLYDESASPQVQDIGTLKGSDYPRGVFGSIAQGINDSGQVVGNSGTIDGAQHGFLYDASAATPKMIDLNTLIPADSGWTIRDASAINSKGKIAATGYKDGVGTHALLLTPTSGPNPLKIISPLNNTLYDPDGSFSVSGTAPAGSTVELFEGTTSQGTTEADSSSGAWSMALGGVSEGAHTYTARATDAAGNTYTSNSVTVTVDMTAPTVSDVYPADGATGAGRNTDIAASFTEKMDSATFTSSTVTLVKEGTTTPISVNMGLTDSKDKVWISTWGVQLDANTRYTVKIKGGTNGVKDLAGNALGQDYSWNFTTVDVPPTVDSYTPTQTTGVPRSTSPTATFSTNMDPSTITATNIKFEVYDTKRSRWISVTHTVTYDAPGKTATVRPGSTLAASKDYRVTVTTNVKSSTGVALDQDANTSGSQPKRWKFTTGSS